MSEKIKVGSTYSVEQYKFKVMYINDIYPYGSATSQYNATHYHTGHIYKNKNGDEEIQLSFFNDKSMFEYTEERAKEIVDGWAKDRADKLQREKNEQERQEAIADKNRILLESGTEARELKGSLVLRIREQVLTSASAPEMLKDKKTVALLNELTLINTLLSNGIYNNFY